MVRTPFSPQFATKLTTNMRKLITLFFCLSLLWASSLRAQYGAAVITPPDAAGNHNSPHLAIKPSTSGNTVMAAFRRIDGHGTTTHAVHCAKSTDAGISFSTPSALPHPTSTLNSSVVYDKSKDPMVHYRSSDLLVTSLHLDVHTSTFAILQRGIYVNISTNDGST